MKKHELIGALAEGFKDSICLSVSLILALASTIIAFMNHDRGATKDHSTSQRKSILSEVLSGEPIPRRTLVYFRRRLANRLHSLALEQFAKLEAEKKINRADLARRIGREPAQITRWLGGGQQNWTTETTSDLLLGMGFELSLGVSHLRQTAEQSQTSDPVTEAPQTLPKYRHH
jgi:hypothetical protein